MRRLAAGAALSALACAMSTAVYAQQITGGIAGTITNEAGAAQGGVPVTIKNLPTGQTFTTRTNDKGFYTVRELPVGGPYAVSATAADGTTQTAQIPNIEIGAPYQLNLKIGAGAVKEIVVTGRRQSLVNAIAQTGPRSSFTARDIQNAPTFSRDLKDLVRTNPFVTIDPSNSNALLVAGSNNHFNTIYVDGVRQSDDFGLNNSGYPTQRSPFSIDAVKAFNFEIAPYDVRYGDFQGGILNVVTKSGTNEFHGGGFYEQDSNRTAGDEIGSRATGDRGARMITTKFKDQNYGLNIGGPIVKDHLFFFFDWEKYTGLGGGGYVPSDAPGANPIAGVTSASVTQVQNILKSRYGYDPLNYGGTGPVTDEKFFGRLDWLITDNQHLFVTYQQTKGSTYNTPDASVPNKELNLASSDYIYEQDLSAFTADLVSHWTHNLTTELEFTRKKVESPSTLQTGPFANFLIQLPSTGQIDLGPDISRQANNLGNVDKQFKARADYTIGNHVVTAGYEYENLNEFDLFVQYATGAYTFNSSCGSFDALTNLANGVACRFVYQNAFDNNPNTAAGEISDRTNTAYIQDEWRPLSNLTLRAGLRYERYSTPDVPRLNPRFLSQYGFANTATIDGEDILMPRFGFNWQPDPTLVITGGVGLFSGGMPGVYTYNSYQNTGNILGTRTYTCSTGTCSPVLTNVSGSKIPAQALTDITNSAGLGTGNANALDPNFKPPSTWKASISVVKTLNFTDYAALGPWGEQLGDNWRVHFDYYYSKVKEAVLFQDLWELQNVMGTAPDGRPVYNPARYTNSLNRTSGSDILLTNTDQGDAKIWAVGFGRTLPWGLTFDYTYTHQNVRDVSAATSSVALSNFNNEITADPNHPGLATSDYEVKWEHRVSLSYQHKFFGDNNTTITVFGYTRAGLPFSYGFCTENSGSCASPSFTGTYDPLFGQASTSTSHQLLYVPRGDASGLVTGTSDPTVRFAPGFDLNGFNAFLRASGLSKYEGKIAPRNAFRSPDFASIDLHFAQEFPAFFPGHAKGEFYMDIINLGNLIDKNWGVLRQAGFPNVLMPVAARNCQLATGAGQGATQCLAGKGNYYQYDSFRPGNVQTTVVTPTSPPVPTWVIKLGMRYKF